MKIEFREFVPDPNSITFLDSQKLMTSNFPDRSSTSIDFLNWLYLDNPFRQAIGYIAYHGARPVSQLFIIFQNASYQGSQYTIGIASNACTEPEYRNQGLFHNIFGMLVNVCKTLDIPFIWAYPNPSSLRGFVKTGFKIVREDNLEIIPTNVVGLLTELRNKKKFEVTGATEDLVISFASLDHFTILRTPPIRALAPATRDLNTWHIPIDNRQLEWRYLKHPTRKYYVLQHAPSKAIVILRFIRLFGLRTGVIMKTSCVDRASFSQVIVDLKRDLREEINFMTMLGSKELSNSLLGPLRGRFTVPHQLSPRKFPLAVYSLRPEGAPIVDSYSFALGDYEAL